MVAAAKRHHAERNQPPRGAALEPLDDFKADLKQQRRMLSLLTRATGFPDPKGGGGAQLRSFLTGALQRQLEMRRTVFLPLLLRRSTPEDRLDALIEQLSTEVMALRSEAAALAEDLAADAGKTHTPLRFQARVVSFCSGLRRYQSVELSILIPLARVRFDKADLVTLERVAEQYRSSGNHLAKQR